MKIRMKELCKYEANTYGYEYYFEFTHIALAKAIFIATAFFIAGHGVNDAFKDWDKHPVETTIDEVGLPVHELPFPAITVCDTTSLTMPRKNRWNFVEKLLNSLQLIDPEEEMNDRNNEPSNERTSNRNVC